MPGTVVHSYGNLGLQPDQAPCLVSEHRHFPKKSSIPTRPVDRFGMSVEEDSLRASVSDPLRIHTVITFGTFDCLHRGHVRIFERVKRAFPHARLVVGVSSDALNCSKKQRAPIVSCADRLYMCSCVRYVDSVFTEESLELKAEYCKMHAADLLVMGDDHLGRFDWVTEATAGRCAVAYLERTPHISTTSIIEKCSDSL